MRSRPTISLLRLLSPLVVGGALAMGTATVSSVAHAQDTELEVAVAPPADRVEVIPAAPSPNHFWIHGNWGWNGTTHVWNAGRYELSRAGWGWRESRWGAVGTRWHYYPGGWFHR